MERRLFDYNPTFGITRYFLYDEERDLAHIETVQDVEGIIESNLRQRNETDKHTRYGDGMHKVATVPMNILEKLMMDGIVVPGKHGDGDNNKRLAAWLNDSDNRVFRTRNGRV